jgi:hypothetical protein
MSEACQRQLFACCLGVCACLCPWGQVGATKAHAPHAGRRVQVHISLSLYHLRPVCVRPPLLPARTFWLHCASRWCVHMLLVVVAVCARDAACCSGVGSLCVGFVGGNSKWVGCQCAVVRPVGWCVLSSRLPNVRRIRHDASGKLAAGRHIAHLGLARCPAVGCIATRVVTWAVCLSHCHIRAQAVQVVWGQVVWERERARVCAYTVSVGSGACLGGSVLSWVGLGARVALRSGHVGATAQACHRLALIS